jgi:nucleoside-diphosphate kinase
LWIGFATLALQDIFFLEHRERAFFPALIEFMLSGPVVPMVWQGKNIVAIAR